MTRPKNREEIWYHMNGTQKDIHQETLHNLVFSISRQIEAVVEVQGGST
jgi:hypothetical protein